jgi:hypothetical protein
MRLFIVPNIFRILVTNGVTLDGLSEARSNLGISHF